MTKTLPFDKKFIENLAKKFPTPFYIYDEEKIRENLQELYSAFAWNKGFKEFFAVKACPNPYLLQIFREENCGTDCSSMAELILSKAVKIEGENIMFTSNDTPIEEFEEALDLGAIINFDDISHIDFFRENLGRYPEIGCVRYNPGKAKKGNAIIGEPENAKYGVTRLQLLECYKKLKVGGVSRFGLHTMVASNELNIDYFLETFELLADTVIEISREIGIKFEFINIGGGIGIPYKPEEKQVDLKKLGAGIQEIFAKKIAPLFPDLKIFMEAGRIITGPYGYLVTKAIHKKNIYKNYIGTDASMADLMRPGMYGAYHHISVLGKENIENSHKIKKYDITGSLCENCDKFAVDRDLPEIEIGDFLVIHDAGAHGRAMGFNYNGKLRCGELLLKKNGEVKQIRRPETLDDYFATLNFQGL